jgi:hypothetical protein
MSQRNTELCPIPVLAFHGPIEGYVMNHARRNLWRVASSMEVDDLRSEAFLIYARIADQYPGIEEAHFMALFKRCWENHFTDLAHEDSRQRSLFLPLVANRDEDGEEMDVREPVGDVDNEGILSTLLRQAPSEVALVLRLFWSAPQELIDLALSSWKPDSNHRGQGSARINKLLGFEPDFDSVGAVRSYLLGAA